MMSPAERQRIFETAIRQLAPRIRVTFTERGRMFACFTDGASTAGAYADYAQLCGYGVELEAL